MARLSNRSTVNASEPINKLVTDYWTSLPAVSISQMLYVAHEQPIIIIASVIVLTCVANLKVGRGCLSR